MQGEIRELLTNYGPIDVLWFDYDGREAMYDQVNTYALVKKLQPHILLNNRLDLDIGNNNRQILSPFADYTTPEQVVGGYDDQTPWESCMTVSRRSQWAWGGPQDGVKPLETCLNMLISCAGGDGNLLLNVGPTPTGEIAPEQADLLRDMGAWLAKYGDSIYGTRGGPFKPGRFGVSTRKDRTIYLHIRRWPQDVLTLPTIIGRAVVDQAYPELQRCRRYAIEYEQDGRWIPCYWGENLGATLNVSFAPIAAQRLRLNITEATDGPTIWEFSLFPPKTEPKQ